MKPRKTDLRPTQTSIVLWDKDAMCNRITVIEEKDPYFGGRVCLSELAIFRNEIKSEGLVNVQFSFSSFREDGSTRPLPGDRGDLTSQTTQDMTKIARRLGLKWQGNPVFQGGVKEFDFSLFESSLRFTDQAILLARKIDKALLREDMQDGKVMGNWLEKGRSYQVPYVYTKEKGRESYFSYVLREQLEIPIDEV